MSDDPIKRALEVAGEAVMGEMGWKDDGAQDFEPIETAETVAAAAIAAFLRALPVLRGEPPDGGGAIPISLLPMAAAVERAAGGE